MYARCHRWPKFCALWCHSACNSGVTDPSDDDFRGFTRTRLQLDEAKLLQFEQGSTLCLPMDAFRLESDVR